VEAFQDELKALVIAWHQAWQLAWRFFLRDTRADHRQSLLGYVWLVLPLLANTLTWVFLNTQKVIRIDSGSVPYPVFVMTGAMLWAAFNGGVMSILGVVNAARGFLSKVNFPHEALVYSAVLKSVLDAVLSALLLIPVLFIFHMEWRAEMLLFPVAIVASIVLGSALGLFVLPVAALYGDISRGIQLILRFGFFLTPVIFPLPVAGPARSFMLLNPATPIIASGRAWLTGSLEAMPTGFWLVFTASILLFAGSLVFYKVSIPYLIERLG
jgi:lipopolysaccharide transport system permease protein